MPKKIQKAVVRKVYPALRKNPFYGSNIKKLKVFKACLRYKVDDSYRVLYEVDHHSVILRTLGHRKNVYEKFHYNPDKDRPTVEAIAEVPDMLEPEPTDDERIEAINQLESKKKNEDNSFESRKIDIKNLLAHNIPDEYHQVLENCVSSSDLIRSNVPDKIKEQIFHTVNPPTIKEIKNSPQRILENAEDLFALSEGKITLDSLLLRLDGEQEAFVKKFRDKSPSGPWLLKGGPGSGKSTIFIHCIKEIVDPRQKKLNLEQKKKVLFTTYTNSLKNSASYLLEKLARKSVNDVVFMTLHFIAADVLKDSGIRFRAADDSLRRGIFMTLFKKGKIDSDKTGFTIDDINFLDEEIEWMIYGNNIKCLDDYLLLDRYKRGNRLGEAKRKKLWDIFEIYNKELKDRALTTSRRIFIDALESLGDGHGSFDYVFLDEAQDLPPVAIKFAIQLCKDPKNLFFAADINQSIFGRGVSWKSIDKELRFQGRTTLLKNNYRTSVEIIRALTALVKDLSDSDPETLVNKSVYSGSPPSIAVCGSMEDEIHKIEEFIMKSLVELRLTNESVAVLCSKNSIGEQIASKFSSHFNAKYLNAQSLIMQHEGVKVLTMHAAKGLQFPIVIIPQFTADSFPPKARGGVNAEEFDQNQRRVLFVACTRAMKKLLITMVTGKESEYAKYFETPYWQFI